MTTPSPAPPQSSRAAASPSYFNAVSQQVREANLATFEAIVRQAQFVDPY
jgi:hypothetical protein